MATTTLRRFIEDLHQRYVLAVASSTHVWRGVYQVTPGDMVERVPPDVWVRLSAGAGTKNPRFYDWAHMRLNQHLGLSRWLLFRRSLADGKVAFYVARRRNASPTAVAHAAGNRWTVEEDFESTTGEEELANHEVRTWTNWHRHTALGLVASVVAAAARTMADFPSQSQEDSPPKRSACRGEETPCARFSPGAAFIDSPRPLLRPGSARTPGGAAAACGRSARARPGVESLAAPPPGRGHAVSLPGPRSATQTTTVGLSRRHVAPLFCLGSPVQTTVVRVSWSTQSTRHCGRCGRPQTDGSG